MSRFRMALRPFVVANSWDNLRGPLQLFDQHFGMGMSLNDLFQPILSSPSSFYDRPWRHLTGGESGTSCVEMTKDGFKMTMDVQHFQPGEITVKQAEDYVLVEGKHEEKQDEHGFLSRHFVRRYVLPKGVDAQALTSTLSSDGVLTVTAPKIEEMDEGNVRIVNVEQTGKPAIQNAEENEKKK